jgi:hypothetical protein
MRTLPGGLGCDLPHLTFCARSTPSVQLDEQTTRRARVIIHRRCGQEGPSVVVRRWALRHPVTGRAASLGRRRETLPHGLREAGSMRSASTRMMRALRTSIPEGR